MKTELLRYVKELPSSEYRSTLLEMVKVFVPKPIDLSEIDILHNIAIDRDTKVRVALLSYTPRPQTNIETAILSCRYLHPDYPWKKKTTAERIEFCIKQQHYSVLAHAYATFITNNISRVLSHQYVRQNIGFRHHQLSQRAYPTDELNHTVPSGIQTNEMLHDRYKILITESSNFTRDARKHGVNMEDARYAAMNACETQIMTTGTFEAWMHFIKIRSGIYGNPQWEIQAVAKCMWKLLLNVAPLVFNPNLVMYWS